MTKILFVCHGNICRSPAAEFIFRDMLRRAGLSAEFEVASAATSDEELGNGVYPPMRRVLAEHGISCDGKTARELSRRDYERWDLLIGMDEENRWNMRRLFHGDPEGKLHSLMEYTARPNDSVADPWFTRDFERAWLDIEEGCAGLLEKLTGTVLLDFSECADIPSLYRELREKMAWAPWYGDNLDALFDVLTGLPHRGSRFSLTMPLDNAPREVRLYAERIRETFCDAGAEIYENTEINWLPQDE